jgi:hypothetical protein
MQLEMMQLETKWPVRPGLPLPRRGHNFPTLIDYYPTSRLVVVRMPFRSTQYFYYIVISDSDSKCASVSQVLTLFQGQYSYLLHFVTVLVEYSSYVISTDAV